MLVKSLRPHGNQYGDKYWKVKGAVYEHPRPQGEIAAKIVKQHKVKEKSEAGSGDASSSSESSAAEE